MGKIPAFRGGCRIMEQFDAGVSGKHIQQNADRSFSADRCTCSAKVGGKLRWIFRFDFIECPEIQFFQICFDVGAERDIIEVPAVMREIGTDDDQRRAVRDLFQGVRDF